MSLRKLITLSLVTFLYVVPSITASNFINYDVLLDGICEVETSGRYWKIGRAGERSQYQIKRVVWERYSNLPFWKASQSVHQPEAKRVALCYIIEISNKLDRVNIENTVWNIAVRWNGGISRSRFTSFHRGYANRVNNLYTDNCKIFTQRIAKVEPIKISIDQYQDEYRLQEPESVIEVQFPKKHSGDFVTPIIAVIPSL